MITRFKIIAVSLVLALVSAGLVPGPAPAATRQGPYLRIAARPSRIAPDSPIALHVILADPTALPLCFDPVAPIRVFELAPSSRGPGGALRLSRYGRWRVGTLGSSLANSTLATSVLGARKSLALVAAFPLGRAYDLTMPGRYTIRLVTQRPVYLVSGKSRIYTRRGPANIGAHLFLPAFDELAPAGSTMRSVAESGKLALTVPAPYRKLPTAAVKPVATIAGQPKRNGPGLGVRRLVEKKGAPILLQVRLCAGTKPLRLRLTGDPLVDFRTAEVDGPDGLSGYGLIEKPQPHYGPFPNWAAAPLTAYGRWLAKHPPKRLKWKTYTLKPGVAYEYTVPLNLSCRYDMTLSGTYHVRLRLARGELNSGWVDVRRRGYPHWKNVPAPRAGVQKR